MGFRLKRRAKASLSAQPSVFLLRLTEMVELLQTQVEDLQRQVEELRLSPPHRKGSVPQSSQSVSCLKELQNALR